MKNIKRIAVWSGPRNLSTALMRSFGSRNDFDIIDEPFYASYLKMTGIKHPMFDEIIKSQSSDYKEVSEYCKNGYFKKSYQYQKHMTHHMINNDYLDFALSLKNVFLVREPVLVLRSYKKKNKNYDFQDLGFRQQFDIYKYLKETVITQELIEKLASGIDFSQTISQDNKVLEESILTLLRLFTIELKE